MGNLKILSNILFVNLLNPKHQCFQVDEQVAKAFCLGFLRYIWYERLSASCWVVWMSGWPRRMLRSSVNSMGGGWWIWMRAEVGRGGDGGGWRRYAFKLMMSHQFHHWWRRSSEEQPDQVSDQRSGSSCASDSWHAVSWSYDDAHEYSVYCPSAQTPMWRCVVSFHIHSKNGMF